MKQLIRIIFLILTISACKNKKDTEFVWSTESYMHRGTFDPKLYTYKQIEASLKLCEGHFGQFDHTAITDTEGIVDLTEIRTKKREDILKTYNYKKKEIENLSIIKNEFWQKLKLEKLKEIEDEFKLKEIVVKAYSDPKVLKNNDFSELCPEYISLANTFDTTELINGWKSIFANKEYGDKYINYFNRKYKTTADRFLNARADIITFGYWYCSGRKLAELINRNSAEEFKKLFISIEDEKW